MSFNFPQAVVISLAIHAVLALPFALPALTEPPEDPPILVVEMQGIEAATQSQAAVQQQTKGENAPQPAQPPAPETPPPTEAQQQQAPTPDTPQEPVAENGTHEQAPPPEPEQKPEEATPQETPPSPSTPSTTGAAGATNIEGEQEQRLAQTLAQEKQDEAERLRAYVKALNKKVLENLVYPDAGRKAGLKGTARVGFTLLADGSVAAGSLHIASSSGQPQLDASALKTVEASAPFGAPPRPITIAIAVVYGKVAKK